MAKSCGICGNPVGTFDKSLSFKDGKVCESCYIPSGLTTSIASSTWSQNHTVSDLIAILNAHEKIDPKAENKKAKELAKADKSNQPTLSTKIRASTSDQIYDKEVKKYLHEKDGHQHVIMINSFSKLINQNFGVENKYTTQIDNIITRIQEDGYEIVDVKFNILQNQGIANLMEGFNTLVSYK